MNYIDKLKKCNEELLSKMPEMKAQADKFPDDEKNQHRLMRSLMNICQPTEFSDEFYKLQDEVLKEDAANKGTVSLDDMDEKEKGIYLWKGDITRLQVDAIVNAANNQMLGCFVPMHKCIDNAIHSASGVQLRLECDRAMKEQGSEEPTGSAKITDAYNLPCKKVIHTVGPIVFSGLHEKHKELLASCYRECIKLAAENGLKSIAFCCISTGEFRFPNKEAAEIAVNTVREMKKDYDMDVIFNVFKEEDYVLYEKLLG